MNSNYLFTKGLKATLFILALILPSLCGGKVIKPEPEPFVYSFRFQNGNNWEVWQDNRGRDINLLPGNYPGGFYGGAADDEGYSVQQTQDGGYIVAGYTGSFGNTAQVYLIKTNASGDTLWTRTYGGPVFEYGYSVQQTQGTGYIVAGATNYFGIPAQVYLVKTNAIGDTLWTRTYGGGELR